MPFKFSTLKRCKLQTCEHLSIFTRKKWLLSHVSHDSGLQFQGSEHLLFICWPHYISILMQDILNIGYSGCLRGQIKVHSVINHYKFSREMFQNVKVNFRIRSTLLLSQLTCMLQDIQATLSGIHTLFTQIYPQPLLVSN